VCTFFNLWSFENYNSKFRPYSRNKILCSFSPSPCIHLFLPSSSYPWLPMVVSLFLTHLLLELVSPIVFLFLQHSAAIDIKEAKDSIDEEDPRPTNSTWSYVMWYQEHLRLGDVLLLTLSFVRSIHFNSLFFILFSMYILHFLVVWFYLE